MPLCEIPVKKFIWHFLFFDLIVLGSIWFNLSRHPCHLRFHWHTLRLGEGFYFSQKYYDVLICLQIIWCCSRSNLLLHYPWCRYDRISIPITWVYNFKPSIIVVLKIIWEFMLWESSFYYTYELKRKHARAPLTGLIEKCYHVLSRRALENIKINIHL